MYNINMDNEYKFGIIVGTDNEITSNICISLFKKLEDKNISYTVFDLKEQAFKLLIDMDFNCKILIAIGGDGTILSALRKASIQSIPVIGINGGRKGFLAEINKDEIDMAITNIINQEYRVEEKLMLKAQICNSQNEIISDNLLAVNDFNISRQGLARLIRLKVYDNSELIESFDADGILVSTPTGSTAYSLSAGGPVVMPKVRCILLTPVCAHSLHARPIVASENIDLKITAKDALKDVILTIDGQHSRPVPMGGYVRIIKADKNAKHIRIGEYSYYETFRQKMIHWSTI